MTIKVASKTSIEMNVFKIQKLKNIQDNFLHFEFADRNVF